MSNEWNAAKASEFWPDQRGHWAPVSWKDHLHDFNVFYNGFILAHPGGIGLTHNVRPEDEVFGAELRVFPTPHEPTARSCDYHLMGAHNPDGRHIASWEKRTAPVHVIEHAMNNTAIYIRQRQFAHVPGGKPVQRGDEPLFLWVRFEVSDVIALINGFEHVHICLTVLKPSLCTGMGSFNNINFKYGFVEPCYPLALCFEGKEDLSRPAFLRHSPPARIADQAYFHGRRNRLAVPAQRGVTVRALKGSFFEPQRGTLVHVVLKLPARVGGKADVLLPFAPVEDAVIERELKLGYDGALRETERFWRRELKTRTTIRVAEPLVQGWIDNFPRLEAMIAEKHPATGDYGLPSGSYHYEAIWATPFALCAWSLDALGHGREVDKYLETYRRHQGTIKPPSAYLKLHPGYLGSPRTFTSIDWITDHAAILWAAATHGLMSGDHDFLKRWEAPIVKACEFIRLARRVKHKGHPGILPAAIANDCRTESQSAWNDAWTHKALRTAALLLERLGNKRGIEFRKEADKYRAAFQRAYREVVRKSRKWKAPDGTLVPFTPPTLAQAKGYEAAHAFHLDTGAMVLVFGELFPADDPIMRAAVRWFREGPQLRHFRKFSSEWQVPVLCAEMSSCEPCYSWNLFHSFDLGDREKFAMGLYSLFAGGGSRQTFVSCETRDAVSGNCFTAGLALMLLRMAMVHEQTDDLHLLKMAPLAFFENGGFDWRNVPTWFGELSIAGQYDASSRTLRLNYKPPTRRNPAHTLLHLPPFTNLARVMLNGKALSQVGGTLPL